MKLRKKSRWFLFSLIAIGVVTLAVAGYIVTMSVVSETNTFAKGTKINGVDVSNLTKEQAQNLISTKLISSRNNLNIKLVYNNSAWEWSGEDFEIDNTVMPYVENVFNYYNSGNYFQRKIKLKQLSNNNFEVSYGTVLTGLEEKIDNLANEINVKPVDANVKFTPNEKQIFSVEKEKNGIEVDKVRLKEMIDEGLKNDMQVQIDIPVNIILPQKTVEDIENNIKLRASFSTSYENSASDRKFNIKHALSKFNGMVIKPGEEISFNNTTGARTSENGYKKANIILNGVYVEGAGGGVCQASTTLYNALLLADVEILEVQKHSLPSSYVPLAFDAMVSEGYADLRFRNNHNYPIYIKAWGDEKKAYVNIYGVPFAEGEKIERRAEFVRAIPHPGDRIVKDVKGEYANKVTFKGEYLRLKYPQEGYQSRAYIVKYKDGVVVEEKLIRDETYAPQEGIIIEGTEELSEGMSIPKNNVKIIAPQKNTAINKENVANKIEAQNPKKYNP